MPTYTALNTQIDAVKAEITQSLAASTYTAQDLVYVAKTLETLGNLLGINDLAAASVDAQASLNSTLVAILNGTAPANVGKLYVGADAQTFEVNAGLQNPAIITSIDSDDYAQIAFQNSGNGAFSSTDFIAYAENGTDSNGYIDMGITSSTFNDPDFTITGPNDGYIFMVAPQVLTASVNGKELTNNVAKLYTSTAHGFRVGMPLVITGVDGVFNGNNYVVLATPTLTTFTYTKVNANVGFTAVSPVGVATAGRTGKGNLVLATDETGTENKIIFAAGGLSSDNAQMIIIPDEQVHIEIATQSTSTTTGALRVAGGMGVTGNVNIGGDVNINGTISFSGGGTTVETANISVVAPAIFVAQDNPANALDFSFIGEYTSNGTKYTSFSKDATDGVWKLVSGITTKPTTTINYAQAGLTYDKIKVAQVEVSNAPASALEVGNKTYIDSKDNDNFIASLMAVI
jgi:hypothetical protein